MKDELIEQYAAGGEKLARAIGGLEHEDLTCFPVPGTWSIQQIVLHLMDSDLIMSDRMKRIIAEESPTLIGFDESKFARSLFYEEQSAAAAVRIFALNRIEFAKALRRLPESAWQRQGLHNERGPMTLAEVLSSAVEHLEHHLRFVHEKRARLGKELSLTQEQ